MKSKSLTASYPDRRDFIGGSDARIIMGQDEKALIRLWQEKRGEVGPEDLAANLIVQLGVATEDLIKDICELQPVFIRFSSTRQCVRHAINLSSHADTRTGSIGSGSLKVAPPLESQVVDGGVRKCGGPMRDHKPLVVAGGSVRAGRSV